MKRGYTLIEIIITVAITGILSIGMFKAFEAITIRSEKAKILTTLSIDSQSALDQLSLLLYDRAPMSAQGCPDNTLASCTSLENVTDAPILQWYGTASEAYQSGAYSGFIDILNTQTVRANRTVFTPNTNYISLNNIQIDKWGTADLGLVFSGTFEDGIRLAPYRITLSEDNKIVFDPGDIPDKIYEKYYLVDSAYAVTRKKDAPSCPKIDLTQYQDNDLLLYYDYRPWKTSPETMCDGKIAILSKDVNAFTAHQINGTIRLGIDMNRTAGKMTTKPIHLSKQKVVF